LRTGLRRPATRTHSGSSVESSLQTASRWLLNLEVGDGWPFGIPSNGSRLISAQSKKDARSNAMTRTMTPSTLFEAYRASSSKESLVALLQAQQNAVYNLCYQILRHPEDAQDATQQVLLSILDALPKIADAIHFKRRLYRTAFHVALDL